MLQKFVLAATLCFLSFTLAAQVKKDSLLKVMGTEVCAELTKKDLAKLKKDELEMQVGLAFIPSITKYEAELKAVYGENMELDGLMEKVSEDLALRLMTDCPTFLTAIAGNSNIKAGESQTVNMMNAVLVKLVPGEFTHLLVKDNKGRVQKLWWMDYFEGADGFVATPNKKMKISYVARQVYNARLKIYSDILVITAIE